MSEPAGTPVTAGPYTQWEIPDPITWRFEDINGDPINLANHTAGFVYRHGDDPPVPRPAEVTDGELGEVTYTFVEADMALWGEYQAEFWAQDAAGEIRRASAKIRYEVAPALAIPDL